MASFSTIKSSLQTLNESMFSFMQKSVIQSILILIWRCLGYNCKKVRFTHICGDSHFIDLCEKALDLLNTLNPDISEKIAMEKWLFLFTGKTESLNTAHSMCGISNGWIQWKERGILAYILYAHFLSVTRSNSLQNSSSATEIKRIANVAVTEWLLANQFPIELVNCFRTPLK